MVCSPSPPAARRSKSLSCPATGKRLLPVWSGAVLPTLRLQKCNMHSFFLKTLIFPLVWLTCVISQGAEDPVLRDLMTTLATAEDEDHAAILDDMVQTGDVRLLPFFNAYREGSVYAWSNQAVVVNDITRNDDLDEFAALLDPLTQEPLTDDAGKARIVPIEHVTEVETGRKNGNWRAARPFYSDCVRRTESPALPPSAVVARRRATRPASPPSRKSATKTR